MDGRADARQTTHEWVLARLRREIYDGVHQPGARLVQTEIATRLGVSVTPVREAMRDLVADGLIVAETHKPVTVRDLDVAEATEINDLRIMLEPLAARRATPHISDDELRRLEELDAAMRKAHEPKAWAELNQEFHMVIIGATRMPNLIGILTGLRRVSRFYFAAALRADDNDFHRRDEQHRELIARMRARDVEGVGEVMDRHFSPSTELARRLAIVREGR
ncbi:GntR family transcriptional regulator [Agrococcus jejuensis]|uniref:GntR family transcriptional regulator n=1 Tax=Agrococcus jejuensis TaxID=399736 RepID=UPI0011A23DBE|nr:GntR family transcriptional regulator [Agrococcus jejuensis]